MHQPLVNVMYKYKIFVGLILIVYLLYAIFQFSGNSVIAYNLDSLIIPLITLIYILSSKKKNIFLLLFLLCYSISDLMGLFNSFIPNKIDYYLGNSLYILAYFFLFVKIALSMDWFHVLRNFKIHLIVLTALNVYLVYVLQVIVGPYVGMQGQYFVELVYNTMMLLVLSGALLNYFYRDNKKGLYLFIGSLCIVFSEVIEVAYIYISQKSLLGFLSTTLALGAFYFFYQQSKLFNEEKEHIYNSQGIRDTTHFL